MAEVEIFCCYHLVRPYASYEVAYVGIGHRGRPHEHAVIAARGRHPNRILQSIFNKARRAGYEALTVAVIAEGLTWEAACRQEREEIALYGRIDQGTGRLANMTDGGDGVPGFIQSDEVCRKMSLSRKGQMPSESCLAASRIAVSKAQLGKPKSAEHRTLISNALRGKPKSPEHRVAMSKATAGKPKSAAFSVASRAKRLTAEHRAAIGRGLLGRKHSEETKEKMRAARHTRRGVEDGG